MMPTTARRVMVGLLVSGLALALPVAANPATAATVNAFTKTVTLTRTHLIDGVDQVVDSRKVTLSVSKTTNLRNRQEVDVSWSGARPTAGLQADLNSSDARHQEYPMVLLQCRGIDSTTAPESSRLDPTKCWTQTSGERYQSDYNSVFPPWRLDRYAAANQRVVSVGAPSPLPRTCSVPESDYWVPIVAADGKKFYGGTNGCGGLAPEMAEAGTRAVPSNTTYAVTGLNGVGSSKFVIWTEQNNASLGCSEKVPCSLVAVPIMGISCDKAGASLPAADQPPPGPETDAADATCRATGKFAPGQLVTPGAREDIAVSGGLWFASSNWRNRITVPLSFAPSDNVCDLVGGSSSVDIYGSELLIQATTQWAPTFCLDSKRTAFKHIQTGEPQARSLLSTKSITAGFVSGAPQLSYSRPTVNAPTAVTGFGIGYTLDTGAKVEFKSLKLTPRLLAKLLTSSYPVLSAIKTGHLDHATVPKPDLLHNPLDMSLDAEFQALNPGIPHGVVANETASTLLSLSSDSDVVYSLTSYINADPEARAFLDGKPDPWGMTINSNYLKIALPVYNWPQLDTFKVSFTPGINDCLRLGPVPYLPLVAAPMSRMTQISQAMQYSLANSQTTCVQPIPDSTEGQKLVSVGRQAAGYRFMLGVVPLADADRYQINTAALQTHVTTGVGSKFTSSAGRNFVAPTYTSLRAAALLAKPDGVTGTWPIPYASLRTDAKAVSAYPGTMIVYTAVATTGVSAGDAKGLADFIRYATTTGQVPGDKVGQLPPGYVPLTAANGFGALAAFASKAADAVAAQKGIVPSNVALFPSSNSNGGSSGGGSGTSPGGNNGGTTPPAPPTPKPSPSTNSAAGPALTPVSLGVTSGQDSGAARLILPIVLLLALLGVLFAPITTFVARRRANR